MITVYAYFCVYGTMIPIAENKSYNLCKHCTSISGDGSFSARSAPCPHVASAVSFRRFSSSEDVPPLMKQPPEILAFCARCRLPRTSENLTFRKWQRPGKSLGRHLLALVMTAHGDLKWAVRSFHFPSYGTQPTWFKRRAVSLDL